MNNQQHIKKGWISTLFLTGLTFGLFAQNAVKDTDPKNDIMMQTFGWGEYDQPRITAAGGFYDYYLDQAAYLNDAGVDMMWFPPPSQSTGGTGYIPTRLYDFASTSWGTESEMEDVLDAYNALGMYPISDIVVNHRGPSNGWVDFTQPTWGCESICADDDEGDTEANSNCTLGANDTGEDFSGVRDLNHASTIVQEGVEEYLDLLKVKGFKGWRWDLAKGFSPSYFGDYNTYSDPYYSVGEYWDGNADNLVAWIDGTGGNSGVFDFANYYQLSSAVANNSYGVLNVGGKMPGLAGRAGYDDKAVTFVDNHDTFVEDAAILGDDILKAYAYLLTHPGIPCVSAMHYYGGSYTKDEVTRSYTDNQVEINKMMGVRKQNGINAWSAIDIQESGSSYAAYVSPSYNSAAVVAVRLGSSSWAPNGDGWILNASGTEYSIWSKETITVPTAPDEPTVNISLIGEGISSWTVDIAMTSSDNKTYTLSDYSFGGGDVKFRANASWDVNWGGTDFPSGTGVLGSDDNIPVDAGAYDVTFNRITGAYSFTLTGEACICTDDYNPVCANGVTYTNACEADCEGITGYTTGACAVTGDFEDIGIIGPATSADVDVQWATDVDMETTDGYLYTLTYTFLTGAAKFRQGDAWTTNWGGTVFPAGTGVQDGDDIPVTAGTYSVTFNRSTGDYRFTLIDSTMSVRAHNDQSNVSVFPNPTTGILTIVINDNETKHVRVFDAIGKVVVDQHMTRADRTLDLTSVKRGLYFARIAGSSGTTLKRIQVVK